MDSTLEALEKVLTDLKKVGGVEASAAASRDGPCWVQQRLLLLS
jgi:predicted regulator of Ras-like GTPase activity (Roadblock/LC7/MglB family)